MAKNSKGFYVYEHWRPDTNTCFYVGKGRGNRARSSDGRNLHYRRIIAKLKRLGLKPQVKFVAINLLEEDAFSLEIEKIRFWREQDIILTNHTNGGEGLAGMVFSVEHRAKIGAASKQRGISKELQRLGTIAAAKVNKGRKKSPEQRARMSAGGKGKKVPPEHMAKITALAAKANLGRKHSPSSIAKIRAALIGRQFSSKELIKMGAAQKWRQQRERIEREVLRFIKGKSKQ